MAEIGPLACDPRVDLVGNLVSQSPPAGRLAAQLQAAAQFGTGKHIVEAELCDQSIGAVNLAPAELPFFVNRIERRKCPN